MSALVYALIVASSRVTDHKHHPGDVAAGAIMGTILALLSLARVRDFQRFVCIYKKLELTVFFVAFSDFGHGTGTWACQPYLFHDCLLGVKTSKESKMNMKTI